MFVSSIFFFYFDACRVLTLCLAVLYASALAVYMHTALPSKSMIAGFRPG